MELAYHVQSLIFQFLLPKRADFLEMFLHHLLTIFLISFSYLNNYIKIGTLVLLVHDISDIFSYLIKSSMDSQKKYLILTSYLLLLASWGYGRLFLFPFYIIYSTLFESLQYLDKAHMNGWGFFNLFLVGLLCLHIYWYSMFLQIGFKFANSGKMQDTIEDGKDKTIDPDNQFKTNGKKINDGKKK